MIHYSITKTINNNEARYILLIPSLTSEKPLPHFNSDDFRLNNLDIKDCGLPFIYCKRLRVMLAIIAD